MLAENFFRSPRDLVHRRYEALRAFYIEGLEAAAVSSRFGYTVNTVYTLARNFMKLLRTRDPSRGFFVSVRAGRKAKDSSGEVEKLIVELRKKYLSVPDIKTILDSLEHDVSEKYIYNIIHREGFARLPRRSSAARSETLGTVSIEASKSELLEDTRETFQAEGSIGVLCFLPYLQKYRIDKLLQTSSYPETKSIPRLNAILSFLALKLSNVRRYTSDDLWCMDRGLGLFAGLNVLPKAAWFTSYSHRVTRKMNKEFLQDLSTLWRQNNLLSDTANLDFSAIPYWGDDDSHLENNWSGTRHKALTSILAILSHDPDSGIITYGDTTVRHKNKAGVAVEFVDFYRESGGEDLKYLVFDSKFTTYQNLRKLDEESDHNIKFLTIRMRGKQVMAHIHSIPQNQRKKIRVPASNGKKRLLYVIDEIILLKEYGKEIRQVAISGHGRIKPAIIITNDFELPLEILVRKYARRWLVEKTISQQIEFFHFNRVSSSMVIKVDFDLTMSILAHNIYRLFALDLDGYSHHTPMTLFKKFIHNGGDIRITQDQIIIDMKKKRHLPAILQTMDSFKKIKISWLNMKTLVFRGASRC